MSAPQMKDVKHPLKSEWTLYFDQPASSGKKPSSEADWDAAVQRVGTFDTVEDFWGMYNNVKTPSLLEAGSNYRLFRTSIEPKWEDPANANGGKWVIILPNLSDRKAKSDEYWRAALLAVIGERLHESDGICGVICNVRRLNDKIILWTRNANDAASVKAIGQRLKQSLALPDNLLLTYSSHYEGKTAKMEL